MNIAKARTGILKSVGVSVIKCSNCGHENTKTKLTLSIDRELLQKAKKSKINLSQLMEDQLRKLG